MATEYRTLRIKDGEVPIKVVRERRRSVRAYLGKDHVIVRLPSTLPREQEQRHWNRLISWVEKQLAAKPGLLARYQQADYQDGDTLRVGERTYQLRIAEADRKTHGGRISGRNIALTLRRGAQGEERSQAIRTLLSRLIGGDFLPAVTRRVHELNQRHFQRPIKAVRLKYNHSNWGSCSNSGNINLSTRLLFAPPAVIDYVIVHELAHLVELNHSARFWAEVERAMPNYREYEQWLQDHGHQCDF